MHHFEPRVAPTTLPGRKGSWFWMTFWATGWLAFWGHMPDVGMCRRHGASALSVCGRGSAGQLGQHAGGLRASEAAVLQMQTQQHWGCVLGRAAPSLVGAGFPPGSPQGVVVGPVWGPMGIHMRGFIVHRALVGSTCCHTADMCFPCRAWRVQTRLPRGLRASCADLLGHPLLPDVREKAA